ncbi:hypothetical protein JOD43_003126 [Pullulanibacillus pueri]|uniref:DUF3231 family protein n=2 Tax=Pullulanibacillus pueri TaxID=1437324 RepID=A0A8J3ENJ3_9BACL|nr:hypothetical protein [Pullulanibacillus pueri]GGH84704.1 hypothetical protein GCM10007096_28400 [Pullulanibacillus pueri]
MGKLWATYVGNTLGKCVISYFLKHVDDSDIKKVLDYAMGLSEKYIKKMEDLFQKKNFPTPIGLTEEDVNLEAPRLFYDEFYLHYMQYLAKAGMSIYSAAIPLVTRKDVRQFFAEALDGTVKLLSDVHDLLKSKGTLNTPPPMPPPKGVHFVQKQDFLNGFIGDVRPLHGLEVAHLFDNLNNDITSKALINGFMQVAKDEKVKKFLERGENINRKHIEKLSQKLSEAHLPSPPLLDHLVTKSTTSPFSDKLMTFHKIDMFSMKIRSYANGASLNGRRDIGSLYGKCMLDVSLYVEDGANIMIEKGWMEQPPEVIDREDLTSK